MLSIPAVSGYIERLHEQLAIEEEKRDDALTLAARVMTDVEGFEAACNALALADRRVEILRRYIAALGDETC